MFTWIAGNIGNIVVSLILTAIVTAAIVKMIKDKKNGVCSCGENCSACGMSGSCQRKEKQSLAVDVAKE